MNHLRDIKITVGIHNDPHTKRGPGDLEEQDIDAMVSDIGNVVRKYTNMDSYVVAKFTKEIGIKVNS